MALTLYEAAKLSRNPLARGVMLGVATTNQLMSLFPWMPKSGSAFDYVREKTLADAEFVSPIHTSIVESGTSFDRVVTPMRLIETDVDTYNYTDNQDDPNGDPRAIQLAYKLKAAGRLLQAKMITGGWGTGFTCSNASVTPGLAVDAVTQGPGLDSTLLGPGSLKYTHSGTLWQFRGPGDRTYGAAVAAVADGSYTLYSDNPSKWITVTLDVSDATADGECLITFSSTTNEPDGLNKLISPAMTIASSGASGDALNFDVMDKMLYEYIKVKENMVFLMNGSLLRKYRALARTAAGGLTPEMLSIPMLGQDGQVGEMKVPQYDGVPILQVDDIPSTETKTVSTLSSMYLVSLGSDANPQGFYGGVQAKGGAIDVNLDPRKSRVMGFKLYDVGQLEGKGAHRDRVEWFGAYALGSSLAAVRAKELVTV